MRIARKYQSECFTAIQQAFRAGKKRVLVQLPTGSGKCLARGTPVLMFDGTIRLVEDIQEGDLLMGPDSKPRRVLSLATGQEEMYRVTPVKGDSYVVNKSHILSLKITNGAKGGVTCGGERFTSGDTVNVSVADYLESNRTFRHCAKGWRARVDFAPTQLHKLIPPYILGLWLSDGTSSFFTVSKPDPEIESAMKFYADSIGHRLRVDKRNGKCPQYHVISPEGSIRGRGHKHNLAVLALDDIGVLNNKHIPHSYKTASREARLALLAGILDGDGHATKGGFDYISVSERLAEDTAFVARSLGLAAYISPCKKGCQNGFVGDYFRVSISGDCSVIPMRIERKKQSIRKQIKSVLLTGIKSVELIGIDDYFGFTLDGDGLFMLGDFTVTHNTIIFVFIAKMTQDKGGKTLILCNRDNLIKQTCDKYFQVHGTYPTTEQAGDKASWLNPVVVGSIQSMQGKRLQKWPKDYFKLVITDEVHGAASKTFRNTLEHFENAYHVGFSATIERSDGQGIGWFYEDICYSKSIDEMIDEGWLVPFTSETFPLRVADEHIRNSTGEEIIYDPKAFEREAEKLLAERIKGRKALLFYRDCASSLVASDRVRDLGINSRHVDSSYMSESETSDALKWFASENPAALFNSALLSTGYDQPDIDMVVVFRLLKSSQLWIQMLGRALRPIANVDACADAESRKLAISMSAKPSATIVNIFPENAKHRAKLTDITCLVSMLKEDREEVRKKLGKKIDMADLAMVKAALEQVIQDKERKYRKSLEQAANAAQRHTKDHADVWIWDILQTNREGEPATSKQIGFLRHLGCKDADKLQLTKAQASRVIGRYSTRKQKAIA